ncbi:Glyco_trans_2-like domain-containing protein [Hyphomicrobiales bacterium]|nr:Glyco_trans_2-like domain-containing protein [Hyphomicrobiales bacterium]CAH1698135.1 Glyco_trans_2-like domain-containing protein [Hyphomicrobiales bacterium]CAI0347778.1 Glyco_trans_2-like domain-containing protein [Hyphomicrobiales bacterium]
MDSHPQVSPLVSVLVPVHNAERYLAETLRSVLAQTFTDFELLAVDDLSTDDSPAILSHFAAADPRVRVLRRSGRSPGLAFALNFGLDEARGALIARLDADDIALPHRLERQVEWLSAHPDHAILGSFIEMMDSEGNPTGLHREPLGAAAVALHSVVGTPFAHPAVMMRREFLEAHRLRYHEIPAQDYDLWARMLVCGAKGDNIPEALVRYRVHPSSDSNVRAAAHEHIARSTALRQLAHYTGGTQKLGPWLEPRFQQVAHAVITGNTLPARPGDGAEVQKLQDLLAMAEPRLGVSIHEIADLRNRIAEYGKVFQSGSRTLDRVMNKAVSSLRPMMRREGGALSALASPGAASENEAAAFIKSVPVFINTRDRVACLQRLVAWLERAGHENITIIDNASTYPPLVAYLEATRHRVIRSPDNLGHTSLWKLPELHPVIMSEWFVYTDPDVIPSEETPLDAVFRFKQLMQSYPHILKTGFGLRIDDLPDHYHLKQRVVSWESGLYGREIEPEVFEADIDTTFALYRPGVPYCYGPALRTMGQYQARHLPWYTNSAVIDDEEAYYRAHALSAVTTWNVAGDAKEQVTSGPGGVAGRETFAGHVRQALKRRLQALRSKIR